MAHVDDETQNTSWLNQPGSNHLDFDRLFGARGAADMSYWRAPAALGAGPVAAEPGGAAATPQHDGATSAVGLSGDAKIDCLLSFVKWADGTITYAFPQNATDYELGYPSNNPNLGFGQLTVAQQAVYHNALNTSNVTTGPGGGLWCAVEGFTNLGITALFPTGNATLRAAYSTDPGSSAYAYYPSTNFYGGDAWFGTNSPRNYQAPVLGGDAYRSTFHEIGHQLGLKHAHEASNGNNTIIPSQYDSHEYTVMTYHSYVGTTASGYTNETYGHPQSWMMLDIAALQYMYGADFTHNGGDTTYSWSTTTGEMFVNGIGQGTPGANRIFLTIWDGNGVDTFNLSNYTSDLNIDLSPGGYSDFHSGQSAYLGGGPNNGYARGNVFNALLYNNDERSLIENVIGGSGNDTIYGNNANNDFTGNGGNDNLYGYDGADTLRGGTGNDYLKGGGGADTLQGGDDNDTLKGGGEADSLDGGAGIDTVTYEDAGSAVNVTLGSGAVAGNGFGSTAQGDTLLNIENLTGSGYDDVLTGNEQDNVINGGSGGADTMSGLAGSDTYYVDNAGDVIVEGAGGGTDKVFSSVSYTLAANVENLTLTGTNAINATGNALANVLTGNDAANLLNGNGGADTMSGLGGDDTYYVNHAGDTVIEAAGGGHDTVVSKVSFTLGANVEDLRLSGSAAVDGTGNALDNVLWGNGAANILNGRAGADTMYGGGGDDTYVVFDAGDVVKEAAGKGTDRVLSWISYTLTANVEGLTLLGSGAINGTGNALDNTLWGNDAANVLNGNGGADAMHGMGGDDTYYVSQAGDTVFESAGSGHDRVVSKVDFTLGANVEDLRLSGSAAIDGTGNTLDNTLWGNGAANYLNGRAGADKMYGGAGDDSYEVGSAGDLVVEAAGKGTDKVFSWISYALTANVENLTLIGNGATNATGNVLDNILVGNDAANTLNGGSGADKMYGGAGNDTYIVFDAGDLVSEAAGKGTDQVFSRVSYTLTANVENLTLTGTAAVDGTGNTLANTIRGNGAANVLNGKLGLDTLTGGLGQDKFVFDTAPAAANLDRITDFSAADDTIRLKQSVFSALSAGALDPAAFRNIAAGNTVVGADDHILYDQATGSLYYDANGGNAAGRIKIAILDNHAAISASDFFVF